MSNPPADLVAHLERFGQGHALAGWELLDAGERESLVDMLRGMDLDLLARLYKDRDATYSVPDASRIAPLPHVLPDQPDIEAKTIGEQALAAGEVAVLVVAGGQGTRLGFE